MTTNEPSEASVKAAEAIIEAHSSGFRSDSHDMESIAEDFARALDAAREEGWASGMREAAGIVAEHAESWRRDSKSQSIEANERGVCESRAHAVDVVAGRILSRLSEREKGQSS